MTITAITISTVSAVSQMPRHKPATTARMGRPPRAGVTADRRLELRVTADEIKRWTTAAGESPVSRWVIDVANRAAKRAG